ncbi:MAG: response regulator [Bacillota bacterium]|jgi:DNA-binding response OmpR family regulator
MRVLVVEDDEILRGAVETGLAMNGFTVDAVETVEDARSASRAWDYDAVVLDIALPDGSGLDLLQSWREQGEVTPVLMLTARNATRDRIQGLDLGADDYLGKPFDLDELAARVRAIARRAQGRAVSVLQWGDLRLDPAARTVTLAGEPVALPRREFAVLQALMEKPEHVRSRAQLEDRLYGWQEEVGSNAIEVHVHNLRNKLGRQAIETVRGEGYRMGRP